MNLSDLCYCGNRLDTSRDLNGKRLFLWGPDVGIGDWANMSVGLSILKEKFPHLEIGVVHGSKIDGSFFPLIKAIDCTVSLDMLEMWNKVYNVDIGLNIQIDDDSLWKNSDGDDSTTIERQMTELGLPLVGFYKPQFDFDAKVIKINSFLPELEIQGLRPGKFIVHHCGATNPALRWPHEYVWKFAHTVFEKTGFPTVVIGRPEEWEDSRSLPELFDFTGKYSIAENMAIMMIGGWFVGGHSAFNCIGGGLPIKMVSMYAYFRHYYMWSGFYRNSYDLVPYQPFLGLNGHLIKHAPEKVADIFLKLFKNEIQLPYLEILRWRQ